jgi:hypothetical protein
LDEPSVTFDCFLGSKFFVEIYKEKEVKLGPTICTFATIGY